MRYIQLFLSIIMSVNGLNAASLDKNNYSISDFGAIADGKTLNTLAIQQTIDKASSEGGGRVIVPAGTFLTGCIQLKSNVELHLLKGAVLLGSTNPYDYFRPKESSAHKSPKTDDNSELGLILAVGAENIRLTGFGTIDGQGLQLALNADSLHHTGQLVDKNYNYRRMRPSELVRPKLFRFLECRNIRVRGLELTNSANWGLSFDLCRNLILDSLRIINRAYWNNDGIDITDCRQVHVTNCYIDAADDGICLKSYHPDQTNDSIHINGCEIRSSASAVKFGTGSYGGFRNVSIENISVFDTFRSAIAIESVDGAIIENIRVNNIVAKNTGNAFFIRLGHRDGDVPGKVRAIHISNMQVDVPFERPDEAYDLRGPEVNFFHNSFPASIAGLPCHPIENVVLENITIRYPGRASKGMAYIPLWDLKRVPEQIKEYPEYSMFGELPAWGLYVRHAHDLHLKNIQFKLTDGDYRPAFVFDDVKNLKMNSIQLSGQGGHPQYIQNEAGKLTELKPDNN
ncbi:MAG: glycoside hydrolase family 28 protein [Mangrovibacterium sp.]